MDQFYPSLYRLNAEDRFLIWVASEKDCFFVDASGVIPSFPSPTNLRASAETNGLLLEPGEPILHDLDWVVSWITAPNRLIDCAKALAAWNLFVDVATADPMHAVRFRQIDEASLALYNKIFWGNNLPAVTPEGEHFIPEWSEEEIASLSKVLDAGLDLFKSRVGDATHQKTWNDKGEESQ